MYKAMVELDYFPFIKSFFEVYNKITLLNTAYWVWSMYSGYNHHNQGLKHFQHPRSFPFCSQLPTTPGNHWPTFWSVLLSFLTCFILPFPVLTPHSLGLINKNKMAKFGKLHEVQYGQMRKLMVEKVQWLAQDHISILIEQRLGRILILKIFHNTVLMIGRQNFSQTKLEYLRFSTIHIVFLYGRLGHIINLYNRYLIFTKI